MHAKSLQLCPTLCYPMDCGPLGSSVHEILQARRLEWIAVPSSRGSSWSRDWTHVSLHLLCWQAGSLPLVPPGKSWHAADALYIFAEWMKVKCESESVSHTVMSDSLWRHELLPARLLCPWNYPGKNTGVGCHSLLQGIFSTQGSNPGLLHCRQILYCLRYQGSPLIEWMKK